MLKKLNLNGAVELTVNELKSINGGSNYPGCPAPDTYKNCFSGPSYCPNPDSLPICVKQSDLQ